ncbi:MAG: hypothetical protein ACPGC9_00235 [Cytophagales bacterium]
MKTRKRYAPSYILMIAIALVTITMPAKATTQYYPTKRDAVSAVGGMVLATAGIGIYYVYTRYLKKITLTEKELENAYKDFLLGVKQDRAWTRGTANRIKEVPNWKQKLGAAVNNKHIPRGYRKYQWRKMVDGLRSVYSQERQSFHYCLTQENIYYLADIWIIDQCEEIIYGPRTIPL